jgi:hypothetical protein
MFPSALLEQQVVEEEEGSDATLLSTLSSHTGVDMMLDHEKIIDACSDELLLTEAKRSAQQARTKLEQSTIDLSGPVTCSNAVYMDDPDVAQLKAMLRSWMQGKGGLVTSAEAIHYVKEHFATMDVEQCRFSLRQVAFFCKGDKKGGGFWQLKRGLLADF